MNTNVLKKALAGMTMLSVFAGVALNVNAAAIQVDSVTYNGTNTITVADADKDFSSDAVTTFRVTDQDGNTVSGIDATDVTESNGSFSVDVTAEAASLAVAGIYSVSFVTTNGDFSSATFTVGGADSVVVSANVLPILTMKVTGGAVSFGDLVADTATTSTTNTTVTVDTNAANGYILQVANTGLVDGSGNEIPAADTLEDLSVASNYGYGINATVNAGDTIDTVASAGATVDANFAGAGQVATGMGTAANLTTATGPVANQATTVSYHAKVSSLQATGNYTDTVTYSITGSF